MTLDIVDDLDRGSADREHRDLRARGRHRRRGRRGGRALLLALPGHVGLLAREHAVRGRLRADRHAGDRDQRRVGAGPARACHLPRPVAASVPRRRRRHAASMRIVVKLGSSLVATSKGAGPAQPARRAGDGGRRAASPAATRSASCPPARSRSARRGSASRGGRRRCASSRLRRPSARRSSSRPGSGRSAASASRRRRSCSHPPTSPTGRRTSTSATPSTRCSGSARSRS